MEKQADLSSILEAVLKSLNGSTLLVKSGKIAIIHKDAYNKT